LFWQKNLEFFVTIFHEKRVYKEQKYDGGVLGRVASWFIFKPKISLWVNFGGNCYRRCWYILWTFGLFYGHLVYFKAIWYILW
jgi:hypothetical protein